MWWWTGTKFFIISFNCNFFPFFFTLKFSLNFFHILFNFFRDNFSYFLRWQKRSNGMRFVWWLKFQLPTCRKFLATNAEREHNFMEGEYFRKKQALERPYERSNIKERELNMFSLILLAPHQKKGRKSHKKIIVFNFFTSFCLKDCRHNENFVQKL